MHCCEGTLAPHFTRVAVKRLHTFLTVHIWRYQGVAGTLGGRLIKGIVGRSPANSVGSDAYVSVACLALRVSVPLLHACVALNVHNHTFQASGSPTLSAHPGPVDGFSLYEYSLQLLLLLAHAPPSIADSPEADGAQ